MQAFLTEKTRQEKLQKKSIEKRNLFGLGFTSLIAACGAAAESGSNIASETEAEREADQEAKDQAARDQATRDQEARDQATRDQEARDQEARDQATRDQEARDQEAREQAERETPVPDTVVEVAESAPLTAGYTTGTSTGDGNKVKVEVNLPDGTFTFDSARDSKYTSRADTYQVDLDNDNSRGDLVIGLPQFYEYEGKFEGQEGSRIIIYWDVTSGTSTGTDADNTLRTEIHADRQRSYIGSHAPDFLQIGGKDGYDMVIRSQFFWRPNDDPDVNGTISAIGAVYILWDIADYKTSIKTITLDSGIGSATSGSLTIHGVEKNDYIGHSAPEFLQIDGDTKHDMVIWQGVIVIAIQNKEITLGNKGAIYILWDVADYKTTLHKTITLDDNLSGEATAGSLTIYGAKEVDSIGVYAPKFLQLGGKDGYDMVITSYYVDKVGDGGANDTNEGAIYILWDVADYTGHKKIDLANPADASSGLLTIYGKETIPIAYSPWTNELLNKGLGSDNNNILYGTDDNGNTILGNFDKDAAGTIDIAFRDKDYTYILFGDKVAEVDADTGKVKSKTIDLASLGPLVDKDGVAATNNEGFFSYDFDGAGVGEAAVDKVGYRFASRKADLKAVQIDFPKSSSLSDTDADLGVWDIA